MMKIRTAAIAAGCLFVAGIGVGMAARPDFNSAYVGKPAPEASRALADIARQMADEDSWELIAVGRVSYLGGDKAAGQAMFDRILSGDHEDSDEYRIARVYAEAGEWEKARPIFDRFLLRNPKDEQGLAEVGAHYLLQGDRETAEKLFARSFAHPNVWATLAAAGAYAGVAPQE